METLGTPRLDGPEYRSVAGQDVLEGQKREKTEIPTGGRSFQSVEPPSGIFSEPVDCVASGLEPATCSPGASGGFGNNW